MEKTIYDSHMHTPMSGHSKGWPIDYAKVAVEKNLKGICFTDHAPMPKPFIDTHINGNIYNIESRVFEEYFSLINYAKKVYEGKLDIRLGVEIDFIPKDIEHIKNIISRASFDYVLGSVYSQKKSIFAEYYCEDPLEGQKIYYKHMTEAAKSGLFDCITHPDVIRRSYSTESWMPEKIESNIDEFLDALKSTNTSMELNTSGFLEGNVLDMYPCEYILKKAFLKNIPIVLGSDAHELRWTPIVGQFLALYLFVF